MKKKPFPDRKHLASLEVIELHKEHLDEAFAEFFEILDAENTSLTKQAKKDFKKLQKDAYDYFDDKEAFDKMTPLDDEYFEVYDELLEVAKELKEQVDSLEEKYAFVRGSVLTAQEREKNKNAQVSKEFIEYASEIFKNISDEYIWVINAYENNLRREEADLKIVEKVAKDIEKFKKKHQNTEFDSREDDGFYDIYDKYDYLTKDYSLKTNAMLKNLFDDLKKFIAERTVDSRDDREKYKYVKNYLYDKVYDFKRKPFKQIDWDIAGHQNILDELRKEYYNPNATTTYGKKLNDFLDDYEEKLHEFEENNYVGRRY